jgi:hypothetical protein
MATYDSDDEICRSPLLEPQTILYGPSVSPPPFRSETPLPRLGSQEGGRKRHNSGPRPSQGDRVLISHLAPNHPDIAPIAGEFPLYPEPGPVDEEGREAIHHKTEFASTEPRAFEKFTLVDATKFLGGPEESEERTGGNNAVLHNNLAVISINWQESYNRNSGPASL